jgi:branched-chain amino acid transport system substrate-binding protein
LENAVEESMERNFGLRSIINSLEMTAVMRATRGWLFAVALCSVLAVPPMARAQMPPESTPIKVGVAFPLTGPIASNGRASRDGVKLAFDEENDLVAGRKIELLFEDTQGKPDVGLTKIKSLVERDHVDLLVSVVVSTVAAAVAPFIQEAHVPWITTGSLVALTRSLRNPYTFRMVPSSYQFGLVAAEWAKKQGWKKIDYIGWNAAPAREAFDAIKKVYGDAGISNDMFPNVGTPDYSPYLTELDPSKADGVLVSIWGDDAPRIARQYVEFGLKGRMPFFGVASFTAEEGLAEMPPEVEGVMSAYIYCGTLQAPQNQRFVENYEEHYAKAPGPYAYLAYMGAKAAIQAIKDVGGHVEDHQTLLAALRKVQLNGPMGKVSFDERQGMISDFYVLRVVRRDGKLENSCVERIPQSKDPYDLFP